MYKIFIDTTQRENRKVILYKDAEVMEEISGALDIVSDTQKLLKKYNLSVKDIDEFKANPGPGSFTGIKIGITIANVLNWALGKKSVGVLQKPEYGGEPNVTMPKI
jgi:tRNA threonylcarbamoyladenosine biosynthesis protein TsaB